MFRKTDGDKYISFNGKKYALCLDALKKVCLSSSADGGTKEFEITQVYQTRDDGEFSLDSKVEHETKVNGNPQNDMIIYDIVKLLIITLLENDKVDAEMKVPMFNTTLAINTLLSWGVLEELE